MPIPHGPHPLIGATAEHVQQVGLGAEGTELGALAAVEDHRAVHLNWGSGRPQWQPQNSQTLGDLNGRIIY